MRSSAIVQAKRQSLCQWVAVFAAAVLLAACSASQPSTCRPDDDPYGSVGAVAGRVLIGIAEVVVGAKLVDHDVASKRVACTGNGVATGTGSLSVLDQKGACPHCAVTGRPVTAEGAATALPSTPVALDRPEHESATTQASRSPRRQESPATAKSETVRVRPGRWILVRKLDRTLSVYEDDRRIRTYPIVLGNDPMRPKLYEGDGRTPEGEYHIVSKHDHPAWQRFLLLDYPTAENQETYSRSRARGLVPARGGQIPGAGGAIGIHGSKDDALNRTGVNWTRGCISLLSRDIRELYDTVPVGTPVVIQR